MLRLLSLLYRLQLIRHINQADRFFYQLFNVFQLALVAVIYKGDGGAGCFGERAGGSCGGSLDSICEKQPERRAVFRSGQSEK